MHTTVSFTDVHATRNYRDMLRAMWPWLRWRHAGIGVLQAYIREDDDAPELRVHLWHPDLVKPGIVMSGLCHNHRFDMRSHVLAGRIIHIEMTIMEDAAGAWMRYEIPHARKAMAEGGTFAGEPIPCATRYDRKCHVHHIDAGSSYTFAKRAYHESHAHVPAITLVEKHNQEDFMASILAPVSHPLVHSFTETMRESDSFDFAMRHIDLLA